MVYTEVIPWQVKLLVEFIPALTILGFVLLVLGIGAFCERVSRMFRFRWLKNVEVTRGPYKGCKGRLVARRFLLRFVIDAEGTSFFCRVWRWQVRPLNPK